MHASISTIFAHMSMFSLSVLLTAEHGTPVTRYGVQRGMSDVRETTV